MRSLLVLEPDRAERHRAGGARDSFLSAPVGEQVGLGRPPPHVDDDADVLDAVCDALLQEGFTVRQAHGGAAALDVRDVPVVFMTGDGRFRPENGAQVLEKPFGLAELIQTVRRALGSP